MKILTESKKLKSGFFGDNTYYPWINIPSGVIRIILMKECNYNCPHCFAEGESNRKTPMLDVPYIIKIMDFAHKYYGVRTARLTGGEPLLYPDLKDLFVKLHSIDIEDIDITTNGYFLEDKINLLKSHNVTNLKISLNTIDPEMYKKLSGQPIAYLQKVLAGAQKAKQNNFKITLVLTALDTLTVKQIMDVADYAKSNNFDFRMSEPYHIVGRKETKQKLVFKKAAKAFEQQAKQIIRSSCESVDYLQLHNGLKVTIMHNLCDNRLCDVCVKYLYIRLTPNKKLKPCLSRTDTEVSIPPNATEDEMHQAFMKIGAFLGKGLKKNDRIGLKL